MTLIILSNLPSNGNNAVAENVVDPVDAIVAVVNGNLDDTNIASLSGTKITAGTIPQSAFDTTANAGWNTLGTTLVVSTGYNTGQKEFLLATGVDKSAILSVGMRLKFNRGTSPSTQCTDLESSSSQYASKTTPTGITFTDDYTCEAWIRVESYKVNAIVSRHNGSTGFIFYLEADGRVTIDGQGSTGRTGTTTQSIPLGRWVHVAGSLDMSANSGVIYIDGVSVPVIMSGSDTSLTQAGNLAVGAWNSLNFFDGEIADVRVWNIVRTSTQIRDNMNQALVGNETNLVAYFKLNGNFNDSTSNANNLSAQGGAIATTVDNPWHTTEYGIITKVTSSNITIFTGTDYSVPNMTLSTIFYSSQKTPYGFPRADIWYAEAFYNSSILSKTGASNDVWYNGGTQLSVPTGSWELMYEGLMLEQSTATGNLVGLATLSPANNTNDDPRFRTSIGNFSSSISQQTGQVSSTHPVNLASQTVYYANQGSHGGSGTINLFWYVDATTGAPLTIRAKSTYA